MKLTFLLLLSLGICGAATLAEYTFDNPTGTAPDFTSTDMDVNSTASSFTAGNGVSFATTVTTAFTSDNLGLQDGLLDNIEAALGTGQFFSFTLTAEECHTLNLTDISLLVGRAPNGAQDFYLFSDVTGFTVGNELAVVNDIAVSASNIPIVSLGTSLASNPAFQGLTSVEFRVYFDDRASNNNSSSATLVDNVLLQGDSVIDPSKIPEPTSIIFLGLGGLTLLGRRKRA